MNGNTITIPEARKAWGGTMALEESIREANALFYLFRQDYCARSRGESEDDGRGYIAAGIYTLCQRVMADLHAAEEAVGEELAEARDGRAADVQGGAR